MANEIKNDNWINIDEAAEYLGVQTWNHSRLDKKKKKVFQLSQGWKTLEVQEV